jgi:hypothetical protein
MTETVLTNARLVLADEIVFGSVVRLILAVVFSFDNIA